MNLFFNKSKDALPARLVWKGNVSCGRMGLIVHTLSLPGPTEENVTGVVRDTQVNKER